MKTLTAKMIQDRTKELGRPLTRAEFETLMYEGDKRNGTGGESSDWRTFAISQKDLFSKKLEPIQFLVADLIPDSGVVVLAGKPKIGKSQLVLDGSQRIAGGMSWLDKEVRQGKVVYLALEDGQRRLRERLERLHSAPNLPITYITDIKPLNTTEGFDQLEDMIRAETPALLVIDTLASATDRKLDQNSASDMASLMNQLHTLALTYSLTILVIAHHGKKTFSNPGFDVRGSSATPSASDCNIGFYKVCDGCYDLRCEGRDIPDTELRLYFDTVTWTFQVKGDARDSRRVEIEDKIIEAIESLDGEADATMIGAELGISRIAARSHLLRMQDNKQLNYKLVPTGRTQKIVYSLPETVVTPLTPYTVKDTVKEVIDVSVVSDVKEVIEVIDVSNKDTTEENLPAIQCNTVSNVTPVSGVKITPLKEEVTLKLPAELPAQVIKSLGNITGEGLYPCVKGSGGCCLQSKYSNNFACSYTPSKCPFWRGN